MIDYAHALQIGTLSTWLSVAGFGTVGIMIHPSPHAVPSPSSGSETVLVADEFTLGSDRTLSNAENPPEATPLAALPAPPELPDLAETEPLPDIPALPAAETKPSEVPSEARKTSRVGIASRSTQTTGETPSSGKKQGGKPASASSGMSNATRFAAGRMPSPAYPPLARRKGQSGTVLVEFTVGSDGRVISARAKVPSQWSLLNHEAVTTVRTWRFPPGGVMTLQRPIVFQLR